MKNKYTIVLMSSAQNSVRQFSIGRWPALLLCILCSLIIGAAVVGSGYGIYYKFELQGTAADKEQLEKIVEKYNEEMQVIQRDMQDIRKMEQRIRQVLGLGQGTGILGRGGGGQGGDSFDPEEVIDNEQTYRDQTPPAVIVRSTDFEESTAIDQLAQLRREITSLYNNLEGRVIEVNETPSILPITAPAGSENLLYWYSSEFGYRLHPLTKKGHFHKGLDLSAAEGTPIIATANGVVTQIEEHQSFGNMIQLEHKSARIRTLYGHLRKHANGIHVGKKVNRGEIIGYMGNTGQTTGTHLHYGVYANGKWQNPRNYIIDLGAFQN